MTEEEVEQVEAMTLLRQEQREQERADKLEERLFSVAAEHGGDLTALLAMTNYDELLHVYYLGYASCIALHLQEHHHQGVERALVYFVHHRNSDMVAELVSLLMLQYHDVQCAAVSLTPLLRELTAQAAQRRDAVSLKHLMLCAASTAVPFRPVRADEIGHLHRIWREEEVGAAAAAEPTAALTPAHRTGLRQAAAATELTLAQMGVIVDEVERRQQQQKEEEASAAADDDSSSAILALRPDPMFVRMQLTTDW